MEFIAFTLFMHSFQNGEKILDKKVSVPDDVFDDDMSSAWSEMTPIESVVDNDSADHNVNILGLPTEITKLEDIESYGTKWRI